LSACSILYLTKCVSKTLLVIEIAFLFELSLRLKANKGKMFVSLKLGIIQINCFCCFKFTYLRTSIFLNNLIMDSKTTGTVKFFNTEKGFGFIRHDDSNKETFVHASGLIDEIKENDHVEFDLQSGQKGMNAVNVKRIG